MGERNRYAPGTFSWVDLATTDASSAKSFYGDLFGWEFQDMPAGDLGTYTMFLKNGKSVAGCYEQYAEQKAQGIPPNWLSYITVASADEGAGKTRELGGDVLQGPLDVVDSGRMTLIADPQGAVVAMWEPRSHTGAQIVNEPGALTWNELRTNDQDAAKRFYVDLFGWATDDADMGPAGTYTILKVGDRTNGGIITLPSGAGGVPPHWAAYFVAEDCDKAVARVQELGGRVVMPPMDVPQGRIASVTDPQGANFSLFAGSFDP